jgi:retinol dehydrogenase-12
LEFLYIDLADLTTIKPAVTQFLSEESRLDVLVNNAAIMYPPDGSKSIQGYDLQTATNVYGPFLLSILLHPILAQTVPQADTAKVRIVWCASHAPDLFGPVSGVDFVPNTVLKGTDGGSKKDMEMIREGFGGAPVYAQSKAADIMLGVQCATQWGPQGIISVSLNPGNLRTELVRDRTGFEKWVAGWMNYPAEMGAWTELFAGTYLLSLLGFGAKLTIVVGWSPEITPERNGSYVIPWGRFGRFNGNLERAIEEEKAKRLWEVCEGIVEKYM